MNNEKNDNDNEPQYIKEERAKDEKVQDSFIGAPLVGSYIAVIASYVGWIGFNDFFGLAGCWVVGYFLNLWILKPILQKRGWY